MAWRLSQTSPSRAFMVAQRPSRGTSTCQKKLLGLCPSSPLPTASPKGASWSTECRGTGSLRPWWAWASQSWPTKRAGPWTTATAPTTSCRCSTGPGAARTPRGSTLAGSSSWATQWAGGPPSRTPPTPASSAGTASELSSRSFRSAPMGAEFRSSRRPSSLSRVTWMGSHLGSPRARASPAAGRTRLSPSCRGSCTTRQLSSGRRPWSPRPRHS
mmetsp:Transcript_116374/g.309573  ORF Transcript_116374/g.309573 Transcript_116374/m.309573 type:complete len:215 (+) Transcript_116374:153-797(+)